MSQQRSLFRPEAIAFQQRGKMGEVVLLQPVPAKLLFWSLVTAFAMIASYLALAQYARKETVTGYLAPTAGVAKVFVPRNGIITDVHVRESQIVVEGQALLTVAIDQTAADGQNVDSVQLATLARQKAALREQIEMQEDRAVSERKRLEAQIAGAHDVIAFLEEQIAAQAERVRLVESLVDSVEGLRGKGYISEADYKRRRETFLESKQNLSALSQQLAGRRAELAQAAASLEQLPTMIAEKVQALRNLVADGEQRIAEIEGRRAFVVRAPIAGRISTLQAAVGRAIDPRQSQLSILPQDSLLQAELFVPTRAIGFVRPGQQVRVLYDAFPYQHFGTYGGRVAGVARTMLTSADLQGPLSLQQPAYKVTVVLNRQNVDAYGERVPLQPDMLLKADILLDRRSLLSWLLDPLLSARVS
ncbi:MAG: HlyD family efflux transporter periplasmic adaptor subunit [Bradyrhizobium sp.]